MKKKTIYLVVMIMLVSSYAHAVEIFGGGFLGTRSLNESTIKDTYDNGGSYLIAAGVKHMGIFGELGFSGFKRDGESTEYSESSEFSLTDFNLRIGYELDVNNRFFPKAYLGLGSYSVKETVESDFLPDTEESKFGFLFGLGIRIHVYSGISLEGRIENISLKVTPYEDEVDLGGWRMLFGISFYFNPSGN